LAAKRFDLRPNTHQQLGHKIKKFVKFLKKAGCESVADISRDHVTAYRGVLLGYGDSTQRQHIVAIKQFLRDAERDDLVKRIRNPKPTPEGQERRKPRPFSDEEIKQFLRVAPPR
jgi:site-specific recombinase XerD